MYSMVKSPWRSWTSRTARDPAEAARIAAEIGGRVAIKILSPDIVHKSDVGGVRLDLSTAEVVAISAGSRA